MKTSYRVKMLDAFRKRAFVYIGVIILVFFIITIQLINLQVVQGSLYIKKSKQNMEDYIPITAPRGEIYDRHFAINKQNKVLVSNRPSFNITTIPAKFSNKEEFHNVLLELCELLELDYNKTLADIKGTNPWQKVIIKEDVDLNTIVKLASFQEKYPNISWQDVNIRVYNESSLFAHTIGYIGSISEREYKKLKSKGYKIHQKIGKYGLEKQYDGMLRGIDGHVRRIVDVRNRTEGEEIGKKPIAGRNLVLTIDYEIQKILHEAIGELRGTAVVLKPATGEVLALVSKPDFDPNLIIAKNNSEVIKSLNSNKGRPFLNRSIQAKYPPSSTFKLIAAIAALEEEKWKPHWAYYCPGTYILKGYIDKTKYCNGVHGKLDLYHAIGKSCNVYFYNLGYKIGPTALLKYANYFGLNSKTGVDLPGEISGFLPSKKWKRRRFGQSWFDGDTINLAIGQGFMSVTPIEIASFVSGIVNNGLIYRPHLIKEIRSQDNKVIVAKPKPDKIKEIPLSTKTLDSVKLGMRLSVLKGTSMRLKYLKVPVAGKTGTAQTRSKRKADATQHGWFTGFAPYNGTPEETIVITVLVEYGIAGAVTAVPIAERVLYRMQQLGYFEKYVKKKSN